MDAALVKQERPSSDLLTPGTFSAGTTEVYEISCKRALIPLKFVDSLINSIIYPFNHTFIH